MCVCVGVCVLLASVFSYKKQNKNNNLSPIFAVLLEYMSALFKSLVRLLSCGLSLTFGGRAELFISSSEVLCTCTGTEDDSHC